MNNPPKAFISYSHENKEARGKLVTHLAVMVDQNELTIWDDSRMAGGDVLQEEIFKNLAVSDILFYLVSAASLASRACKEEVEKALSAGIKVIPIILESCDWLNYRQLSGVLAFPTDGKPINTWVPESEGWSSVVKGIRKTVEKMQSQADLSSGEPDEVLRAEEALHEGNVQMTILGQLNMAIESYSDAIALDPRYAAAYTNRGCAHREKGEFDTAIKDFTKAIELEPNRADTYSNRGAAYRDKGEFDKAIADFTTAIELDPNFTTAYYGLGLAYDDKGEIEKAIGDFDKAIELNPDYAEAYSDRGIAYMKKGNLDIAIANYNKAIELKPDYAVAYNNRGIAYVGKDGVDTAIKDFTKAIELNPGYFEAYNGRGTAYGLKGDLDTAINDFDKAIALNPNYVLAYNNRGFAYQKKRERHGHQEL